MTDLELRAHQTRALRKMSNGCILAGDVGSGKSIAALAYYYMHVAKGVPRMKGVASQAMENPIDVYIITTAKKRGDLEWEVEGSKFGLFRESNEQGVQLYVDSWNNIQDYADVTGAFFIFDEQRLVGSGAWVQAFHNIAKNNQWIVLSATPGDVWMDYVPIFLAHGFYKNRTEFVRRHVVFSRFAKFPKVERYVETAYLEKLRQRILVEMPFERHTRRHHHDILVDYDKELYDIAVKRRKHVYDDLRPIRDAGELFQVLRRISNSDLSRFGAVLKVIEKHPRLIVFYNFNYELDILRGIRNVLDIPVYEWNGQKHDPVPTDERWVYLVQYTAGAEGWNCTTTDATLFYSLTYSYKSYEQAQGRIDRLNTPYHDLHYYILRSQASIDGAVWKSILTKKDFNKKAFMQAAWGRGED